MRSSYWISWPLFDPPGGDYYTYKKAVPTLDPFPEVNYYFWLGKEAEAFNART